MKVIVCTEPYKYALQEEEMPQLGNGEALVRIRRIGICGTDLHAYQGNQPFFSYPRVLGHELAGEIVEVGENEQGLAAGDRVTVVPYLECGTCIACRKGKTNCCTEMRVMGVHVDGGMREYYKVPVDHLIKVNQISLDEAVAVEPLCIGAHALRRAEVNEGEFALVIGAGPIGLGVMKFAKLQGAKVIALDINKERLQFCQEWAEVDYLVNGLENPLETVAEITNGEFPEVVFDATGNKTSMMNAFQYVSHGGKLVYVGLVKEDISFHDPEFHKKEMSLLGSRNATREDFEYVIHCLEKGRIDVSALITHRSGFEQMIEQFDAWLDPKNKVIKAVVEL